MHPPHTDAWLQPFLGADLCLRLAFALWSGKGLCDACARRESVDSLHASHGQIDGHSTVAVTTAPRSLLGTNRWALDCGRNHGSSLVAGNKLCGWLPLRGSLVYCCTPHRVRGIEFTALGAWL